MPMTDPIADMLARIRNAVMAHHEMVALPASNIKYAIAKILQQESFAGAVELLRDSPQGTLRIALRYYEGKEPVITGLKRVSRPGHRVYVSRREVPRVYRGRGLAILSTSQGVMAGYRAWRQGLGGEVLCYVW